jgi:hypothetical protein
VAGAWLPAASTRLEINQIHPMNQQTTNKQQMRGRSGSIACETNSSVRAIINGLSIWSLITSSAFVLHLEETTFTRIQSSLNILPAWRVPESWNKTTTTSSD